MPSKNKPNAFIVYAQSIRQQLIAEGHTINGMPDLVAAAGPYWKQLSEEEKEQYKKIAKERGAMFAPRQAHGRPDRRDTSGELIANRVNLDEIKQQRRIKERQEVTRQWPSGKDVIYEKFFFISFSIMLDLRHLAEVEDDEKVVPCEVSILEYSINQGLGREIHKFINPGNLRLGFKSTAMSKSENSHKIPIQGLADEDETYAKIYEQLCRFVMVGRKVVPPLFCKASEVEQTELALRWLSVNARRQPMLKKVYELEGLLLDLESHLIGKKPDFMADTKATSYLNKSVYDYEKDARCAYHEEEDVKFCSSGVVKKWGYLFSDLLCPKADVQITSKHLPCVNDEAFDRPNVNDNRSAPQFQEPHYKQTSGKQYPMQHHQQQQQQQHQQPQRNGQIPVQRQRQRATTPHQQQQQQQQQPHYQQQQQQQQQRISNSNGSNQDLKDTKPPLIGRGRGLAQILSQQRRPGEKPKEPPKLVAGRGRATMFALQTAARSSQFNPSMAPLHKALDESVPAPHQEPSARPKSTGFDGKGERFALYNTAPPASYAPQPPSAWRIA